MSAGYPHEPGYKSEGTSREAAAAMQGKAPTLRQRVLDALLIHGHMTPDETADYLGETILSVRPRFSELLNAGAIVDTGIRRENASGKRAAVYRARTVEQEAHILLESCSWDPENIRARLRSIKEREEISQDHAREIIRIYGGNHARLEAACRTAWEQERDRRRAAP